MGVGEGEGERVEGEGKGCGLRVRVRVSVAGEGEGEGESEGEGEDSILRSRPATHLAQQAGEPIGRVVELRVAPDQAHDVEDRR